MPNYKLSAQVNECKTIKEKNPYENIEEIPEIKLTLEDMRKDPTVLIAELQKKFENYGAIKLKACS